jgi:hypothetical protein
VRPRSGIGATAGEASGYPLAATFERLGAEALGAHLAPEPEDRWRPAASLGRDRERLRAALDAVGEELGCERSDIRGSRLIEVWAWLVAAPAAAALIAESRLPDVGAGNTLLSLSGEPHRWQVGFAATRFYALAADPDAAHADAVIVAGEEAQLRRLHAALSAQLAPLVEALNALTRRPRAALWRGATDRLAGAFLWAGEELEQGERSRELARRTVALGPPLAGRARTQLVSCGEGEEWTQVRDGCCLYYRVPGGVSCASCPLVADSERGELLAAERAAAAA